MRTITEAEYAATVRRNAIARLLEDRYENEADNLAALDGILDNRATPDTRLQLWQELVEAAEFKYALEQGADVGTDDDGRPEDRDRMIEDLDEQIQALLDRIALTDHTTQNLKAA